MLTSLGASQLVEQILGGIELSSESVPVSTVSMSKANRQKTHDPHCISCFCGAWLCCCGWFQAIRLPSQFSQNSSVKDEVDWCQMKHTDTQTTLVDMMNHEWRDDGCSHECEWQKSETNPCQGLPRYWSAWCGNGWKENNLQWWNKEGMQMKDEWQDGKQACLNWEERLFQNGGGRFSSVVRTSPCFPGSVGLTGLQCPVWSELKITHRLIHSQAWNTMTGTNDDLNHYQQDDGFKRLCSKVSN